MSSSEKWPSRLREFGRRAMRKAAGELTAQEASALVGSLECPHTGAVVDPAAQTIHLPDGPAQLLSRVAEELRGQLPLRFVVELERTPTSVKPMLHGHQVGALPGSISAALVKGGRLLEGWTITATADSAGPHVSVLVDPDRWDLPAIGETVTKARIQLAKQMRGKRKIDVSGTQRMPAVGESVHKAQLTELMAARPKTGSFRFTNAQLVRDPDNSHDRNAIAVVVKGHQVGYVDSGTAAEFAENIDLAGGAVRCAAEVRRENARRQWAVVALVKYPKLRDLRDM